MTIFAQTSGQRSLSAVSLSDGNAYDLITVGPAATGTLESMIACNTSGSARTFSMLIEQDGSSFSVAFEKAIAPDDFFHLTDHNLPVRSGSIIRVQADAAGVDVTAVYILNNANARAVGAGP